MMCQILFILTLPDFVSLNMCNEGNILHIWFDDFKMQFRSIHVSIMKDFLEFFLEALWTDSMLYSKYNPVCSNKL